MTANELPDSPAASGDCIGVWLKIFDESCPPTKIPAAPEIVPLLEMPPAKVAKVKDALTLAWTLTATPVPPAEILPLLPMPVENPEMTADAFRGAAPPTAMPLATAAIVALLRMPPAKV